MIQLAVQMLVIQVVILLLVRPIVWWYFGIGRALRALESIADCQKLMNGRAVRASMTRRAS